MQTPTYYTWYEQCTIMKVTNKQILARQLQSKISYIAHRYSRSNLSSTQWSCWIFTTHGKRRVKWRILGGWSKPAPATSVRCHTALWRWVSDPLTKSQIQRLRAVFRRHFYSVHLPSRDPELWDNTFVTRSKDARAVVASLSTLGRATSCFRRWGFGAVTSDWRLCRRQIAVWRAFGSACGFGSRRELCPDRRVRASLTQARLDASRSERQIACPTAWQSEMCQPSLHIHDTIAPLTAWCCWKMRWFFDRHGCR